MTTPDSGPPPATPPQPPAPAAVPTPATPLKKRRWKKILLLSGGIFAGLLLILLIIGPPIIGSVAKSKIASILGEKLQANVTVGDVSFSWSGHVQIDELRILPKAFADPFFEVKKVDVRVDVGAAIGGRYIADVEVVAPKVIVEKGPDGKFNYEFPPAPTEPRETGGGDKAKKAPGKPPDVRAKLTVRDGEARIRGKGAETIYKNLAVQATVDGLDKPIGYALSLESPMNDALKVKGAINIDTISGPAALTLDRVSLRNLTGAARAYSDIVELDGTVTGTFNYELKGAPRFVGKGSLEVNGFSAAIHDPVSKTVRDVRLDRLTLSHDGGIDEKGSGRHVLTLTCGKALGATVTADVVDAFGARLVKTDVQADTDLAALAEVLAKVGALPKGMALAGRVSVRGTCDSRGPTQADFDAKKLRVSAKVDLGVTGSALDITHDGKPMKLEGFTLRHVGTLDESGTGKNTVTLSLGKALGAVVQVDVTDAMGPAPGVKAEVQADSDLGELGKMLEKLIGLKPDMAMEGDAAIRGTVEAKGAESVKADLSLNASNLVAVDVKEKKRHEIDKSIVLRLAGGWDGKTKTAAADLIKLDSSFATMDGKGGASLAGETPEIHESSIILRADLEKLAGKLQSFMEKPPALGGVLTVVASARGEKIGLKADLKALRFEKYGPIDATLKHDGVLDKQGSGKHSLRLESGKALVMTVDADVREAYKDSRATSVDARMTSDLAALSSLLPGVVELKPGTTLAGSAVVAAKAETRGSTWAKFDVSADVDNLGAVEKGKTQEIDKAIRLKAAGLWDGGKQAVSIDTFTLASAFATAEAKGGVSLAAPMTVKDSTLKVQADLEKLGAKLGLFMADAPGLAGSVTAEGSYSGDRYVLDATAKGMKILQKGKPIGPIDAAVAQKGTFSTAKNGGFRIETGSVKSSAVDLKLSGEIRKVMDDAREGEIRLEATARPDELTKWMPDLGMSGAPIPLTTLVALKPGLIEVSGRARLDGLTMKSKNEKGVEKVRTAKTGPIDFDATMKGPDLSATLKTPAFEWIDQGYAAKGGLAAQVKYNEKSTTGTTTLANLEITDDRKNVVKDPGLTIVHDIGLADNNKTIALNKVDVQSSFLRGSITGKLLQIDKAPEFQKLHLDFRYIPDKVTALAKPWLPGRLEGADERVLDLILDGKAASMDALAILRGTRGGIDLDLGKFSMDNGITVVGKTHFDLKDGKLSSGTPLTVNKGKTDLNAALDFNPAERKPASSVTFAAKDVDANGQMGPLLEHLNPIFHTSGVDAKVDGVIQSDFRLAWAGPIDPDEKDWVAAASRSLSGTGTFGVQSLSVAGSPTVGQLMTALGQGNAMQGEIVATQIRIANGRCEYENMTMRGSRKPPETLQRDQADLAKEKQELEAERPKLDAKEYQKRVDELRLKEEDLPFRYVLRFTGYVRFDKKMELRVLMPMTDGMAKAHPNLQKYIGTSFWADLKGTTESPSLDTRKMITEAITRAAEGIVKDKLDDVLAGFTKRLKEKDADKLFSDAQKADNAKKNPQALQSYQRLLSDYADTDFVKKRRAAIEDRIKALGGK